MRALRYNITGTNNVAIGHNALQSNTVSGNTAVGYTAGYTTATNTHLTAIGQNAAKYATANELTAIGSNAAGFGTVTGSSNTFAGSYSGYDTTSGNENSGFGQATLYENTTGNYNSALGYQALRYNTTGNSNIAVGYRSGYQGTTGQFNISIGRQAGYVNTTASSNICIGSGAGYYANSGSANGGYGMNTCVGIDAGYNLSSGVQNTFVGSSYGHSAGRFVTTGSNNTIIGGYDGNQGGLDIRTANNQIVLSDGNGNPRVRVDSVGNFKTGSAVTNTPWSRSGTVDSGYYFGTGTTGNNFFAANATSIVAVFNRSSGDGTIVEFKKEGTVRGTVSVSSSGTTYNTTSDRRLKDNIEPISDATDKLMDMKPVTHTWIDNPELPQVHGFIAQEMQEVVPEAVSGDAESDEMMSMDYGRITPVIVAALQDALKEIKVLKTRIDELENN